MFQSVLAKFKRHFKTKRFLYLELPYLMIGALFLIFAPYKYHHWITYFILVYALIALIVDFIDFDAIKKHDQNSDS